jgi:hypothetical protein
MVIHPLSYAPVKDPITSKSIPTFWQVVTCGNFISSLCFFHLEMGPDVLGEFALDLKLSGSFWQSAVS